MTFLRTRRPFEQRFNSIQKTGEVFIQKTPELYDPARSKVGVSIAKGGRMYPVSIFYKHKAKELDLDFLTSCAAKVV